MGKINTDNYPNRPFASYQDDDMFVLQDNGGETYTTNVGDIKNLADSRIKLEGVQVNGTDLPISGKKVNVDISGKTDLKVIAFPFHDPEPGEPSMGFFKGAYVTYNGKLYEFTQEHQGAWNPSHVREVDVDGMYVRAGNGGYNSGDYATTEGHSTRAEGEASHAEGLETIANSDNQHVEGKYNIADADGKYAHIVGNGTADNARSNAMTLDWDGNLVVSGDIADGNGDVMVEGNPVQFDSPFEQDAKSVVVSVKPIQAGSGTPSPENIRPISGIDEVEIEVSGKNQFDGDWQYGLIDTTTGEVLPHEYVKYHDYIRVKPSTWYTMSAYNMHDLVNPFDIFGYDKNKNYVGLIPINILSNTLALFAEKFQIPSNVAFIRMHIADSTLGTSDKQQLEMGETYTAYEPYTEHTTTIPLPSTLYGGTVDVTEGVLTITHVLKTYTGASAENWVMSDSGQRCWIEVNDIKENLDPSYLPSIFCNEFETITADETYIGTQGISIASNRIYVSDGTGTMTTATFKTFLSSNNMVVVYPLATPTTISLTPTDVELLEGTNVVTTNAEKVAVTYGRSLWQDINDLKTDTEGKLDKSDVADVEGDTASRPYAVNEFMLRADGLYKVTQPIAQNASITASNTTKTTIGAVLTALLNA